MTNKQRYLEQLGITCWVRRVRQSEQYPGCYAYTLHHQGRWVGMLLAESAGPSDAVATLLKKMARAISCDAHGQWYSLQPEYPTLNDSQFVLLLGGQLEAPSCGCCVRTHAPQQLLAEPKYKAAAWSEMQVVFQYL